MLETIHVGMTGLLGYSKGLRVIANNTANLNTPGFKGASLQFADLFYTDGGAGSGGAAGDTGGARIGHGLDTGATMLSFDQGELRQSGNPLDLAVDGQGLFILRDSNGALAYTRAGQFGFDERGVLTAREDGAEVMGAAAGENASGKLAPISLADHRVHAGVATATVHFGGNLSSTTSEQAVDNILVIDRLGERHNLRAVFRPADSAFSGGWTMTLFDGEIEAASAALRFVDGRPDAQSGNIALSFTPARPAGQAPLALNFDFSSDVTSYAAGSLSTLSMTRQDGVAPGALTEAVFDEQGVLVMRYSNGEEARGPALALARFDTLDAVGSAGGNRFVALREQGWSVGQAGLGEFGNLRAGTLEISNVDLSQEFSNLVIMQRGYQASSQIVSTANELLQELFSMKGRQ
jgi:flagellar hook protein FlgE